MSNKWLIILLFGAAAASAKTYDITLSAPSVVHNTTLRQGEYTVKVKGSNVTFTDENGKSVTAKANIAQAASKKFDNTEVISKKVAGQERIEEIRLQGTRTKLEFD